VMEITQGQGVDVIIDPVGGEITDISLKCLAYRGRLCIVGFAGGRIADIKASRLLLKNAAALGVYWSHERDLALIRRALSDICAQLAANRLVVDVGARYQMAELPRALADLETRGTTGKSVIEITGA
jgi:NADPH:quinone reductase